MCARDGSMEPASGGEAARRPNEKWRCRDCYLKDPPVWAAFNEYESDVCKECQKSVSECGFCHWVGVDQLERSLRSGWERQHAPQVLQLIRTRWPYVSRIRFEVSAHTRTGRGTVQRNSSCYVGLSIRHLANLVSSRCFAITVRRTCGQHTRQSIFKKQSSASIIYCSQLIRATRLDT